MLVIICNTEEMPVLIYDTFKKYYLIYAFVCEIDIQRRVWSLLFNVYIVSVHIPML
jgi:hypothetical protein